jgi:hypothetical protein
MIRRLISALNPKGWCCTKWPNCGHWPTDGRRLRAAPVTAGLLTFDQPWRFSMRKTLTILALTFGLTLAGAGTAHAAKKPRKR